MLTVVYLSIDDIFDFLLTDFIVLQAAFQSIQNMLFVISLPLSSIDDACVAVDL